MSTRLKREGTNLLALLLAILPAGFGVFAQSIEHPRRGLIVGVPQVNIDTLRVGTLVDKPFLRLFDFACHGLASSPDTVYSVSLLLPSGDEMPDIVLGYANTENGECKAWSSLNIPSSAIVSGRFQGALYLDLAQLGSLSSGRYIFRLSREQAGTELAIQTLEESSRAAGKTLDTVSVYLDLKKPSLTLSNVEGARSFGGVARRWWLNSDTLCVAVRASDTLSGAIDSLWLRVDDLESAVPGSVGVVERTLCVSGLTEGWHRVFVAARDSAWGSHPPCDLSLNTPHGGLADTVYFWVKVDLSPPTTTLAPDERGRWVNTCIQPRISDADLDTVQTRLLYNKCTDALASAVSIPFSPAFCFPDGEGFYYLQAVAEDSAGNVESPGVWEDSVGYDWHAPVVTGWQTGELCLSADSLRLNLVLEDPKPPGVCRVSGVDSLFVLGRSVGSEGWSVLLSRSLGGVDSVRTTVTLFGPPAGESEWAYVLRVVDQAGNADTTGAFAVRWDQSPPQIALALPERVRAEPWPVQLSVTDTLCGIDSVRIDTSYADEPFHPWHTLLGSCSAILDTVLQFPPTGFRARNGTYHFRVVARDCAGNRLTVVDSTIFFRRPDVSAFVVADTSTTSSLRDHPADKGFANEPVVTDTVQLTTIPEDTAAYLEFAAADGLPKKHIPWRDAESTVQVDLLDLRDIMAFHAGPETLLVRLVRPAYQDTTGWFAAKIQIDLAPPTGRLAFADPNQENNRCKPLLGWTNEPRVRVIWQALSDDVRQAWPAHDHVLAVPDTEGLYRFSRVAGDSAWIDDHAGNLARMDTIFVYDGTTVRASDQRSGLQDPDTGNRQHVDGDSVEVSFGFKSPATDVNMGVRGTWKVAFAFGKKAIWVCSDFDSSEANPHVFLVPDSVKRDTLRTWSKMLPIPEMWRQNGRMIYLSHAFLDSTGDISQSFVDSIRWVGLQLEARFEDPHPWKCQVPEVWSNDVDSILIRVDTLATTWKQIDTLALDYHWTVKQPDDIFLRPKKNSFARPLPPQVPASCRYGTITLWAWDKETGAKTSYTDSLRFDYSKPNLTALRVQDNRSRGLPYEHVAVVGWSNDDTVDVAVGFADDCSELPLGYHLSGDWRDSGDVCGNDTAWTALISPEDGVKTLTLAVDDSAGNSSETKSAVIELDTVSPSFAFCREVFRSRGDSVWVHVRAGDEAALGGFAFRPGTTEWVNAHEQRIEGNQQRWECADSILVPFETDADTFFLYGLSFDKAGNCSAVDSALVLVTRPPQVSVVVYDACDTTDSAYVNCPAQACVQGESADRILLQLEWKRADSLVVRHAEDGLTISMGYTGSARVPFSITSRCNATYVDSVTVAAFQLKQVGAQSSYRFVVDHQKPSILDVQAVTGPNSAEVVPFVNRPEVWVRIVAQDVAPGKVERFWCRIGHRPNVFNRVPDDSVFATNETWYHFTLPQDSTGWWYFGAKAWDAGDNESLLGTGKVDYRKGGAAFCYPNPFTPPQERVALSFVSSREGEARIEIYDAFGYLVWRKTTMVPKGVVDGAESQGGVSWDGRNMAGDLVASGGYICRIHLPDGHTETVKIGVVR